jgi:microcystin-dependent protein
MSWQAGFTPNYELNLATDPSALPVPRGQMNEVFNAITLELQNYQQHGVPNWITASDNGGSAYAYDIYARVRYSATPLVASSFLLYENQVQGNTATPGADSTWLLISGEANGVPTGTIIDFAGATAPGGYLACDGSAVSRTTYVTLFAALTQLQTGTLTNTSASVTGLSSTAQMYAGMPIEGTGVPASTTILSVDSGTSITMSNAATAGGAQSLRFFNWGNGNASTTFNVPSLNRKITVASGGSPSSPAFTGSVLGQTGGEEVHTMTTSELVAHSHHTFSSTSGGTSENSPAASRNSPNDAGTSSTTGSSTPFNVMQLGTIVNKIIKT